MMNYVRSRRAGERVMASGAEPPNELFELIHVKATKCHPGILLHRHAETNWPYTMENRSSEWEPRQVNQIASET